MIFGARVCVCMWGGAGGGADLQLSETLLH